MTAIDSYRMRPHEELSVHLDELTKQCADTEALLESLRAQKDMVESVIAEAIGSSIIEHDVDFEAVQSEVPMLVSVAA